MIYYICNKDTTYNGRLYRKGQPWLPEDGGDPPGMGADWTIRQDNEPDPGPQPDGVVTSASMGFVQWKPQPARPRAQPLNQEEKERLEVDPYDPLDDVPAPPPPAALDPPAGEKLQPMLSIPSEKSQDEKIKEAREAYARQQKTRDLAAADDVRAAKEEK